MEIKIYIVTFLAETIDNNSAESTPFASMEEATDFVNAQMEDIINDYGDEYETKDNFGLYSVLNYSDNFFTWDITAHTINL